VSKAIRSKNDFTNGEYEGPFENGEFGCELTRHMSSDIGVDLDLMVKARDLRDGICFGGAAALCGGICWGDGFAQQHANDCLGDSQRRPVLGTDKTQADTMHVLLSTDTFLGSPLEGSDTRALDFVEVLHTLGNIDKQVGASGLGTETPDLPCIGDIP
jgi:hypothetical protein